MSLSEERLKEIADPQILVKPKALVTYYEAHELATALLAAQKRVAELESVIKYDDEEIARLKSVNKKLFAQGEKEIREAKIATLQKLYEFGHTYYGEEEWKQSGIGDKIQEELAELNGQKLAALREAGK